MIEILIHPLGGYRMVLASMRAVRLFLRARTASTLEITNDEQRALRKFSASWNLSFTKTLFCAS